MYTIFSFLEVIFVGRPKGSRVLELPCRASTWYCCRSLSGNGSRI